MFIKYSICIVRSHVISFPDSFHDLIIVFTLNESHAILIEHCASI